MSLGYGYLLPHANENIALALIAIRLVREIFYPFLISPRQITTWVASPTPDQESPYQSAEHIASAQIHGGRASQ